jgi:uncharacterized membrane protein YphA (DoxX/SURF4 family)
MKSSHVIILAVVLIVAGVIVVTTGWNGIANNVNNPTVVQESKTAGSVVDQMREDHSYSTSKPMNPLVVPIIELILGLIMVGGGLYVIAGNLHIMFPKTKPTPRSGH